MKTLVLDKAVNNMREMAAHFNAELDEGNDAATITMDNHKAKGFISSYRIFRGLTVWVYNITFLSEFKVDLGIPEKRPYYFSYNVKGHYLHRFGEQEKFTKILQNQNMIVRRSPDTSVQIVFPANVELKIAVIILDISLFENLDIRNAKRLFKKIEKVFSEIPSHCDYRHLGGIDTETEKFASILCENNDVDLVGGLLAEGAVFNMLASQIHAYRIDIAESGPKSNLSKAELSKITTLGSYVVKNFETNITILKLSKEFGISPKKLQMGVKYLYGSSVGRYISNLRMGHAKHLFITTDLNVSEVCHLVGITSSSYFSKVFKNRFGTLPRHFKN